MAKKLSDSSVLLGNVFLKETWLRAEVPFSPAKTLLQQKGLPILGLITVIMMVTATRESLLGAITRHHAEGNRIQ